MQEDDVLKRSFLGSAATLRLEELNLTPFEAGIAVKPSTTEVVTKAAIRQDDLKIMVANILTENYAVVFESELSRFGWMVKKPKIRHSVRKESSSSTSRFDSFTVHSFGTEVLLRALIVALPTLRLVAFPETFLAS